MINLVQQITAAAMAIQSCKRDTRAASAMAERAEWIREAVYATLVRADEPLTCREVSDLSGICRESAHEHLLRF